MPTSPPWHPRPAEPVDDRMARANDPADTLPLFGAERREPEVAWALFDGRDEADVERAG